MGPGTDPNQLCRLRAGVYQEKLARDLYHAKYRSLFLDFVISPQTVKTVLHFRGM